MSYADKVFKETCIDILENGTDTKGELIRPHWEDGTPAYTIKKFGIVNRYDLRKEFPAITLRKVGLKSAMDEILWIYQKKSNLTEDLKPHIWDSWASPVVNTKELVYIQVPSVEGLFFEFPLINQIVDFNAPKKESKKYGEYFILEKSDKNVKVQFLHTGNIKWVSEKYVESGNIIDEYYPDDNGFRYGNVNKQALNEFFGNSLGRWIKMWKDMCDNNTADKISTKFRCCEYFLDWVMDNIREKSLLDKFILDKSYLNSEYYSEKTCVLLLPEEKKYLEEAQWFFYDGFYYYSKNSLIEKIAKDTGIHSGIEKHIQSLIESGDIFVIYTNEKTENGYPRFSLNMLHSIGTAYGYVVGEKFKYKQDMIDQMDYVLKQLKETPYSRRIMTNLYQYHDLATGNLDPCCFCAMYNVTKEEGSDKLTLNMTLVQRSQDMLAANGWNICQYAILLMMLAQVNDMIPGELIHVINDCHIYDKHVPMIKELIEREEYPAPKVSLNPMVKNFYEFTTDDLIVEEYVTGPQIKNIPVAI